MVQPVQPPATTLCGSTSGSLLVDHRLQSLHDLGLLKLAKVAKWPSPTATDLADHWTVLDGPNLQCSESHVILAKAWWILAFKWIMAFRRIQMGNAHVDSQRRIGSIFISCQPRLGKVRFPGSLWFTCHRCKLCRSRRYSQVVLLRPLLLHRRECPIVSVP